jgi:surfeit locus 1 family protein
MSSGLILRRAFAKPFALRSLTSTLSPQKRFLSTGYAGDEAETGGNRYNARRNSMFTPTMILVGFVPVFCLGLGMWQVQRLKWKVDLIDELQEKLEMQPLTLPNHVECASVLTRIRD